MAQVRPGVLSTVLVGAVVAIAVVAGVASVGGDHGSATAPEAEAPNDAAQVDASGQSLLPAPGALGGRLAVLDSATCEIRTIDLELLQLGATGSKTDCRAWFSGAGNVAAAPLERRPGTWLLDLSGEAEPRRLSFSTEPVVFSDDSRSIAQCQKDERTQVNALSGGGERTVAGCRPAFAPDGSLLTRPPGRFPTELLRDGAPVLVLAELERGLPAMPDGAVALIGYDEAADGLLAALVARFPGRRQGQDYAPGVMPKLTLELWREGELEGSVSIPSVTSGFGSRVEISPSGGQALVTSANPGMLVVVDLRTRELLLQRRQFGVAWSPDGAWLALGTATGIEIMTATTFELVYELPLRVRALAWATAAP